MNIDDIGRVICDRQGKIFRIAADRMYDMSAFARAYMNSYFCNGQMDSIYSRYQFAWEYESIEEFLDECPDICLVMPNEKYDSDIAEWAGYIYRILAFCSGYSSKEIYAAIPFSELVGRYEKYNPICSEYTDDEIVADLMSVYSEKFSHISAEE